MARVRWVRTIVIEGEEADVRANQARAWLPTADSEQRCAREFTARCTASYEVPADACETCEGRGYVGGGEGCVSECCATCKGSGKAAA